MKNPEITIAMGVYNPQPALLERSLCSLIRQHFTGWELLLYDDGSDPPHARKILEAAEADARIHPLRGEINRGLAHALNVCIRRAASPYIARMDDDDESLPERLAEEYALLERENQYGWVGSWALLTDGDGAWGVRRVPETPQPEDFLLNSPFIHPSVLFRRTVLEAAGGYRTDPALRLLEDYDLFMRLYAAGQRGYNIPHPLLRYREDRAALRRRTYGRRIREAQLRLDGFRSLGLLRTATLPYVIKPLVAGLIPPGIRHAADRYLNR